MVTHMGVNMTALSHYPNQCWPIIGDISWHSHESYFSWKTHDIKLYVEFQNHNFKTTVAQCPRNICLPDMSDICLTFTMQFYNGLHSNVRQMSGISLPHFAYTGLASHWVQWVEVSTHPSQNLLNQPVLDQYFFQLVTAIFYWSPFHINILVY